LSGSLTESPAIGTATEIIGRLPLPEAQRTLFANHVVVADAVCYLFGAFGVIFFCSEIGPRLLKLDLKAEAQRLEDKLDMHPSKLVLSAWRMFDMRAYRLSGAAGKTVADVEASVAGARLFIPRIRRGDRIIKTEPTTTIQADDVCAIGGRREMLVNSFGRAGVEVEDRELLDSPVAVYDVFLTSDTVAGRTLDDIARNTNVRGVFLRHISRGGLDIPITPGTVLQRGDVLTLVGTEEVVIRTADTLGVRLSPVEIPDYVTLGLGIFVGGLIGVVVAFSVGQIRVSLSTSVGVLLAGLVVGWLRTHRPLLGRIPDHAVSMMTSFGLAGFIAMVGLRAGPVFFGAVQQYGLSLFLGGIVVTLVPMVVGLYFGRYVLRMNPLLLLGSLAGAQTMTPALAAVQERSGSPIAVLGYAAAVPFGHILLTVWGAVIVLLVS
jgi:putative transport protein